ncbi:transcription factor HIVEP3 isoform X2 [Pangasianodon hypophthalmus]|uniref:transcription factor HIVEP3 isoform X2 n=1 Tax=Pangasianodon hypophthalmus TaxID=310915 RepID=UPI001479979E|nr:transcription factor HIVEP3 isoform X2 [Pangasianodon hypophthalmus]
MEVSHRQLSTGEQSGGQEHLHEPQNESCLNNPKPTTARSQQQQQHGPSHPRQTKRLRHERKRLRLQKRNVQEADTLEGGKSEWATRSSEDMDVSDKCPETSTSSVSKQPSMEAQESTPKQKRERKPQKPGKYVCTYCGRACAKPSVLQKHIRSHTGERPYPCAPCGFSFKTKSNLYKHRKSHTHKIKAGMASGRQGPDNLSCHEEPVTESDEDTGQLSSSLTIKNQEMISSQRNSCTEISPEGQSQGLEYSHAVKKRLAMRLSKGRRAPVGSSDETSSSFGLGSKGSTESGYFSRSESTEVSQDSLPNTSAKSYAEVILGKFGRLGHLQRTVRQQDEHSAEPEGRSIPFSVPKKQVIDHITKLITINEAVVDTSKLDSVKPRRFSLSRRSSIESSLSKDTILRRAKEIEISSKSSGSITLGVPCEKFQQHSISVNQPANPLSAGPLLRSHSLPSDASIESSAASQSFRHSQSFDEQPAQNRRHGMLRRQPAIELPIGAEITTEEQPSSSSPFHSSVSMVSDCKQKQLEPFECEACGLACSNWEKYKTHKNHHCPALPSHQLEIPACQAEEHGTIHKTRVGGLAVRKRRKEESLELDDPALPSAALSSTFITSQGYIATCVKPTIESVVSVQAQEKENTLKGVSVIQHTSLFNKQEPSTHTYLKEQTTKPNFRKLVRQHNVQIPEIRVTEETNINTTVPLHPDVSEAKEPKKVEDFQWPQRSPSLAQLPIEKLPPKKKRLRLAEATQSSGDSSFESLSVPHSPSQDTHRYSHSTSFEESVKSDVDTVSRRSRAPHTLTISSTHHPHREMQRSASEQAPHIPQQTNPIVETRSKSFDYSCLSPDRTPAGWRERRKCLLIKHSAVREPEEEDPPPKPILTVNPPSPSASISPRHSPDTSHSSVPSSFRNVSLSNTVCPSFSHKLVTPLTAVTHTDDHTVMESLHCLSGAARAHYYSMSSGLKLEIPIEDDVGQSTANYHHYHPHLDITPSQELLRPPGMQRVPVRLYSGLPAHANSVYTTLSQTIVATSQDPSCSGLRLESIGSRFDFKDQTPVAEGSKSSSVGGNKRVLSPTSSVELTPDSQQQKRVKEEEEDTDNAKSNTSSLISSKKEDSQLCTESIVVPINKKETSYTSLDTNLAISWCYLNYVKPNPSAQDDNQNSVYSTWCISTRNPNPPGLTSKDVLSLVYCKQRHTPFTYTTAAMPPSTVGKPAAPDTRDRKEAEVHAIQPIDPTEIQKAELRKAEKTPKEEGEEEAQSTSKYNEILRVQICEGGSSEEYVYVRGRGRGRYVCEECGIRCKKPSMLRKHIRLHTDARPYVCQHCNFAFKTKGNLTKHMKSKAHGKRCPEGTTPGPVLSEPDTEEGGGAEESFIVPEVTEEHQFSDAEDTDEEEDDNEEADEETSQSSASSVRISVCSEGPGCQSASNPAVLVKTNESRQLRPNTSSYVETTTAAMSSSPICSLSPGLHLSPGRPCSPRRDVSPLRCLSPRLSLSPSPCQSSLSPSTRPVSPFSLRHLSPVRAISPICPKSPSSPQSSSFGASVTVQQRASRHRDLTKFSTNTVNSKGKLEKTSRAQRREHQAELLFFRHGQAREGQRVLSHLPLHSQPQTPSSSLSLMIPIGGIQMVQIPTISSGLHVHRSKLNPSMTQTALAELGKEEKTSSSNNVIQYGSAPGGQNQETEESDDKKSDALSAPLTTWKSISQRKERKRLEKNPTHIHKRATIKHTTQTSTDSDATPKSTWKEKASRVSERTLSEKRL